MIMSTSATAKGYYSTPKSADEPAMPSVREVFGGLAIAFSQAQSMHAWLEAGVPVEHAHEIVFGKKLRKD